MARFSDRMVPEVVQVFWAAMARGDSDCGSSQMPNVYRPASSRSVRSASCA